MGHQGEGLSGAWLPRGEGISITAHQCTPGVYWKPYYGVAQTFYSPDFCY